MNHSTCPLLAGSVNAIARPAFRQPHSITERGRFRRAAFAVALLYIANVSAGETAGTALIRRAPALSGGTVDGSVHVMSAENITVTAPAAITRDLLVPGSPEVRVNGNPNFGGTIDGSGSALPAAHQVTLSGKVSLRNVVRRSDPVAIPSVGAARTPLGTRTLVIRSSSDMPSDFGTVRDVTLADGAGRVAVPPGAYGAFTVHDGSGLVLGIAGATEPAEYDFQHLSVSAGGEIALAGPVVITVAHAMTVHGAIGSAANPSWLRLNLSSGGLTLAGAGFLAGRVNAPAGTVGLSGQARLTGGVTADGLSLGGNALLLLQAAPIAANVPPYVALLTPAEGTLFTTPASMLLSATAGDSDGTITKVEFFEGTNKLGQTLAAPFEYIWNNAPPGTYVLTARAYDNAGASTLSEPRNISVQIGLPYFTGFEASDGYTVGALAGQLGWSATGAAAVVDGGSFAGNRAVLVGGSGGTARAAHGFPNVASQTTAFIDLFTRPVAGVSASSSVLLQGDAAHVAFVRAGDRGEFVVFNGNGSGTSTWAPTGSSVPLGSDGRAAAWVRVTLREDFSAKRWDLYVDGRLVACETGFADNAAQYLSQVALMGPESVGSLFDEFFAGFENPLFADADRDGMEDAWEMQNGLSPLVDDRSGDADADGVNNIEEYLHGTRPTLADTDGDGLPDAWEIQYRLAPTRASATEDTDGDGLTDLQEFTAGTNPSAADTDGDGMPDGWEMSYGLDPKLPADAAADADGDGKTNLIEYQNGSNPNEYYNGALPELVSMVGPNKRPGANGLVAVRVTQLDGTPLANAPIRFEAVSGGILLSTDPSGTSAGASVSVRSDAQGIASVYLQYPIPASPLSTLVAIAQSGTQTKSLSVTVAPPITDIDADGLDDGWEQRHLGELGYGANEDPGGVGRTLAESHFQDVSPWPGPVVGSGLQVWYRADLGVAKDAANKVSWWTDVSGNGIHARQADPAAQPVSIAAAAGSLPAVRFNGSTTQLRTAVADLMKGSADITVIAVIKPSASQVAYADILDYNHGTAPYGGFALQQNWTSVNQYGLVWRNGSGTAWVGTSSTVAVSAGAAQVLSILKSASAHSGYLNGVQQFAAVVPAEMLVNAPRILALGNFAADGSRPFNGDVAEVLIYNRALSAAERSQAEAALLQKYAGSN